MSKLQQQVHVDINFSVDADVNIGLENIMSGVGENMAYRLAKMIQEQGLEGTPLKMFATLSFEKAAPTDRWVCGEGEYHWEPRPTEIYTVKREVLEDISSALEETRRDRDTFANQLVALWGILAKHNLAPAAQLMDWQRKFQL